MKKQNVLKKKFKKNKEAIEQTFGKELVWENYRETK
jgi:hypothetical protein